MTFAYLGLKDFDQSLEFLYRLIKFDPNKIEYLIIRARIYKMQEKPDFVNLDLEKISSLDDIQRNKYADAIAQLKAFVLENAFNYKNLASQVTRAGDTHTAIFYLSHAYELDKEDWGLLFKRGILLSEEKQYENAIIDFKDTIEEIQKRKREKKDHGITPLAEQKVCK